MTRPLVIALVAAAAACASPAPPREAAEPDPRPPPAALASVTSTTEARGPVARGELPWWHDLEPGVYRFNGERVVLAVGESADHHHSAEGFLKAKVTARLGVRKAAEPVGFTGTMPEPRMSDLFITRAREFMALYRLPVPEAADVNEGITEIQLPSVLRTDGRHRLGRHVFEGARHLYLECEVEGPVANPDWGRNRATARLWPPRRETP